MPKAITIIQFALFAFFLCGKLYVLWSTLIWIGRKFGLTRRQTLIDKLSKWPIIKIFGRWTDDFGEFRSKKFREDHSA